MTPLIPQVTSPRPPTAALGEVAHLDDVAAWSGIPRQALLLLADARDLTVYRPSDGSAPVVLADAAADLVADARATSPLRAAATVWAYLSGTRPANTRAMAKAAAAPLWVKTASGADRAFGVVVRPDAVIERLLRTESARGFAPGTAVRTLFASGSWTKRRLVTPYGANKQAAYTSLAAPPWLLDELVAVHGGPSGGTDETEDYPEPVVGPAPDVWAT